MNREVRHYGIGLLLPLLALALTYYIPILGRIPWTAAFFAVAIAARIAGFGPALLATVVASCGTYALILVPGDHLFFDSTAVIQTIVFDAGALLIAHLVRGHNNALSSLQASEMHYRSVAETASDVIVTIDSHSNILSINPSVKLVFGYDPEELIGKTLLTLMPERYRIAHVSGVSRHLKTGKRHIPWTGVQLSGRRKDGEEVPVEISFGSYAVEGHTRFTGFIRDVSERRAAQAALMQNEKLAAVGRLASSIAHEINNPLEAITNLIYLSRNSAEMVELQNYLEVAEREIRRISVIANQTLLFHKQSPMPTVVNSADLINNSLSLYQGKLVNANVSVLLRERAKRQTICVEGQIRQVLTNLIGNAIDALPTDGGRILLRTRDAMDLKSGLPGVVLAVADSGTGMSPQTREKDLRTFLHNKGHWRRWSGSLDQLPNGETESGKPPRAKQPDRRPERDSIYSIFAVLDVLLRLENSKSLQPASRLATQ